MVYRPKPLIGINADYRSGETPNPSVSYIFSGYYDSVIKAGGVPVIIPPYTCETDIDQVLSLLDGVILTGGADLDPRRDGYMLHPSLRLMDERREDFDRLLIEKAFQRKLPLFGIGSGMQLLNVSQGGTLFLHIPEDLSRALPHRDPMDPYHRHSLLVEKDSLLGRVYGDNEIRVNSLHHMAVDDVAPGFLSTARCPDSVIEGIESIRDDWFAFGTQFHPESNTATALDLRIFQEFISGIILRSSRFVGTELARNVEASEQIKANAPEKAPKKRRKAVPLFSEEEVNKKVPSRSRKVARIVKC